jgi:hypothetical protein
MANYWNSTTAPASGSEQERYEAEMAAYLTPESVILSDFGDSPCIAPSELFASAATDSYLTSPAESFLTSPIWGSHDSGIDLALYGATSPDLFAAPASNRSKEGTPASHGKRPSISSITNSARKRRVGRNTASAPEDPEDRKAWQKHKNTLAARKSRNRKRHEVDQLTETVRQMREILVSKGYQGPLLTELVDMPDEDEDEE